MEEVRKVRLRQCSQCTGAVYRAVISGLLASGDQGDQVSCTYVEDRCDECEGVFQKTVVATMPIAAQLDPIFDQWIGGEFASCSEFDSAVGRLFTRFGGGWESQAS